MNRSPDATDAAGNLLKLQQQTDAERAVLLALKQDVAAAEKRLVSRASSAHLLEANEQLVFSMLRAHEAADVAAEILKTVSHAAETDRLTELPNRMLLLDRFRVAIASAVRHRERVALLFVDLNKFKQINDALGHLLGDEVLKHAAACLASAVRATDTVSRYGGDEFLVLLTEIRNETQVVSVVEKIIAALGLPTRIGDHVLRLTASIGISMYPDDGEDAYTLTDRADAAMYRAKRQGLGGYAFHGPVTAADPSHDSASPRALLQPISHFKLAAEEHERRHLQRRGADEELILTALEAQKLQATAEQAQQHQAELLAVIAHELRNPMAPLLTVASLIGRVKPAELPRLQDIIERQVGHLASLVEDLLDVARVRTGKLRLVRGAVDLIAVIELAVETSSPAIEARHQRFRMQLPAAPVTLHGDPVRLTQVLTNLLDNASKYTPELGEIDLTVTVATDTVAIAVTDTGIGISADALTHVFEPFVQESHAIGFNGEGLGIGLTLVRELVEAHGGTVVARSGGNSLGSTFVVTLPITLQLAAAPVQPAP
ncbi:MAG: diguanylate cyclase [Herminiimonas sp.]|nr:diguanylate cyclase [Herminiimonas sp.]